MSQTFVLEPRKKTAKIDSHNTGSLRAWLICISAALYFLYDFIQMQMCNVLSEHLQQHFSIQAGKFSDLAGAFLMADVLFLFPAGIILDRVSVRTATLITLVLSITGAFCFAIAGKEDFYFAFFARFIAGIAHAFCFLCCMILATRWFRPEQRALVIGIMVTLGLLGGLIAQTPLVYLVDILGGWQEAILFDVGLGLVVLVLVYLVVKDHPADHQYEIEEKDKFSLMVFTKDLKSVLRNKANWLLGLYTGLMNLPLMVFGGLVGTMYFSQVHSMSATDAAYITSMIFLGTIVGAPLVGWLSDLINNRRRLMLVSAVIAYVLFGMLYFSSGLSVASFAWIFFFLGLVTSAQVLSYPSVAAANDYSISGTAMGFVSCTIMGLAYFGVKLTGVILDFCWDGSIINNVPIYAAKDYYWAFSLMLLGFVFSYLCAYMFKEKLSSNT